MGKGSRGRQSEALEGFVAPFPAAGLNPRSCRAAVTAGKQAGEGLASWPLREGPEARPTHCPGAASSPPAQIPGSMLGAEVGPGAAPCWRTLWPPRRICSQVSRFWLGGGGDVGVHLPRHSASCESSQALQGRTGSGRVPEAAVAGLSEMTAGVWERRAGWVLGCSGWA